MEEEGTYWIGRCDDALIYKPIFCERRISSLVEITK